MKNLLLLVVLAGSVCPTPAAESPPAEVAAVRRTIENFYAAFSARDEVRYRQLATDDYLLLEHGEIMTLEQDVASFKSPAAAKKTRTDAFEFHAVRIDGASAYAIYTLRSDIRAEGVVTHRTWLESAVLRRSGDAWKICLLHSTRVEPPK